MTLKEELWVRQQGLCLWCGKEMHCDPERKTDPFYATMEHVVPRHWGGKGSSANIRLAHYRCNTMRQRTVKLPLAWVQRVHTLLAEAGGYLEGLELADEIAGFTETMQRVESAAYEAIRAGSFAKQSTADQASDVPHSEQSSDVRDNEHDHQE